MKPSKQRRAGLGLIAMQERAELLGGKLRVESAEGGTTISLVLPIKLEPPASQERAVEKGEEVFARHND